MMPVSILAVIITIIALVLSFGLLLVIAPPILAGFSYIIQRIQHIATSLMGDEV